MHSLTHVHKHRHTHTHIHTHTYTHTHTHTHWSAPRLSWTKHARCFRRSARANVHTSSTCTARTFYMLTYIQPTYMSTVTYTYTHTHTHIIHTFAYIHACMHTCMTAQVLEDEREAYASLKEQFVTLQQQHAASLSSIRMDPPNAAPLHAAGWVPELEKAEHNPSHLRQRRPGSRWSLCPSPRSPSPASRLLYL